MEPEEKEFNASESLLLIRSMIETTKFSMADSSHYFLLWGWATFAGCLIQFILLDVVNYRHHYFAWFVTPVALVVHLYFVNRDSRKQNVKTFVSQANNVLWLALGFSFVVFSFIFSRIGWIFCFPFYILLYGIGTVVSGSLIEFKPLVSGGIACFVLAAITPYIPYNYQILLTAFALLVSYIIPGHLLRNHYKQKIVKHV